MGEKNDSPSHRLSGNPAHHLIIKITFFIKFYVHGVLSENEEISWSLRRWTSATMKFLQFCSRTYVFQWISMYFLVYANDSALKSYQAKSNKICKKHDEQHIIFIKNNILHIQNAYYIDFTMIFIDCHWFSLIFGVIHHVSCKFCWILLDFQWSQSRIVRIDMEIHWNSLKNIRPRTNLKKFHGRSPPQRPCIFFIFRSETCT